MRSRVLETEAVNSEIFLSLGLSTSNKKAPEFPRVLSLLSSILEASVQRNKKKLNSLEIKEIVTVFSGLRAPAVSIKSYIERIFKYTNCSPCCFVLGYVYIERFLQLPNVHLTSLNVHRLLITSVALAAKFIDDAYCSNAYYARVGGISTREMNRLEINLLFSLDFKLQVPVGTFEMHCLQLEKEAKAFHVERPVKTCGIKGWTNVAESKREAVVQE